MESRFLTNLNYLNKFITKKEKKILSCLLQNSYFLPVREIACKIQEENKRSLYPHLEKLSNLCLVIKNETKWDLKKYSSNWDLVYYFLNKEIKFCLKNINEISYQPKIHSHINDMDILILFNKGEELRLHGKHNQAMEYYIKGIAQYNCNSPLWDKMYYQIADNHYIHGNYNDAIAKINEIREKGCNFLMDLTLIRGLGNNYFLLGDYVQAKKLFEDSLHQAFVLQDTFKIMENLNSLGETLLKFDPKNALEFFEKCEKLGSSNPKLSVEYGKLFYLKADCLNKLGKYNQALKNAIRGKTILEQIYKSGTIRSEFALATSFFHLGKIQKGFNLVNKVIQYYQTEKIYKPLYLQAIDLKERLMCKI